MLRPALYQRDWMSRYFDDFEKKFFSDFGLSGTSFSTDVIDKGDSYLLKAELPGFEKEDIKVEMKNGYLNISAARQQEEAEKDQDGAYLRRELRYGSVSRSFYVGDVEAAAIKGSYKNGILELHFPKVNEEVPASHRIEIQ